MVIAAGKSRKNVDAFVLIPPDAKVALDALLKYRSEVGVPDANPYMFARMQSETPMSGNTELRCIVNACPGLKHPDDISSTTLRKYVATVSQVCVYCYVV